MLAATTPRNQSASEPSRRKAYRKAPTLAVDPRFSADLQLVINAIHAAEIDRDELARTCRRMQQRLLFLGLGLSDLERDLLEWLVDGQTFDDIAIGNGMSPNAVQKLKVRTLAKLKATSPAIARRLEQIIDAKQPKPRRVSLDAIGANRLTSGGLL